jgi:hypothetical protein
MSVALLMFALPPPPTHPQVEAEKVAWQLAEELGLDVVTILPNFVLVSSRAPLRGQQGFSACSRARRACILPYFVLASLRAPLRGQQGCSAAGVCGPEGRRMQLTAPLLSVHQAECICCLHAGPACHPLNWRCYSHAHQMLLPLHLSKNPVESTVQR